MTYDPQYDEYIFGDIRISRGTREPCPVCGHPTGDCVGEERVDPANMRGSGVEAAPDSVFVEKDVIREVMINKYTKTKILLARGGTYITKAKAKEIGLI